MVAILIINGAGHCREWVRCNEKQAPAYIRTLPQNGWAFYKTVKI